jgi:hypothetical protein
MPRKPLDAPDDLRKQALSQLALAQLQDEVPGMSERLVAGRAVPNTPAFWTQYSRAGRWASHSRPSR